MSALLLFVLNFMINLPLEDIIIPNVFWLISVFIITSKKDERTAADRSVCFNFFFSSGLLFFSVCFVFILCSFQASKPM